MARETDYLCAQRPPNRQLGKTTKPGEHEHAGATTSKRVGATGRSYELIDPTKDAKDKATPMYLYMGFPGLLKERPEQGAMCPLKVFNVFNRRHRNGYIEIDIVSPVVGMVLLVLVAS